MSKDRTIITKEVNTGKGVYVIDVDKEIVSEVKGNNHSERLHNAVHDFLDKGRFSVYKGETSTQVDKAHK